MLMKRNNFILALALGFTLSVAFSLPAGAAGSAYEFAVGAGTGLNDLKSTEGIVLGAWITKLSPLLELRLEPNVEFIAARADQSMFFYGVGPVLRIGSNGQSINPFLDVGGGVSIGSKTMLFDRNFGRDFFFSPTAGAGVKFGKTEGGISLFARWVHHSNAGLFPPNEGIDSLYLLLGCRF
jgi:hypothetical protein